MIIDCGVKTSSMVGRGRGGLLGLVEKDSGNPLDVSEPAEEIGRSKNADD